MLLSEHIFIGFLAICIFMPFSARSAIIKQKPNSPQEPEPWNSVDMYDAHEENDNEIHHQRRVEHTTEEETNTYNPYKKSYPFLAKISQRIRKSVSGLSKCPIKKISHGYTVSSGKYPWFIVIEDSTKEGKQKKICGGVMITPNIALTAAHCFVEPKESHEATWSADRACKNGKGYKVYQWQNEKTKINVKRIEWNRQYRKTENIYKQDVAILYLESDIDVGEALPCFYPGSFPGSGDECVAMGMGETETGETASSLREKTVDVNHCTITNKFPFRPLQRHISCIPQVANKGDSGGPLVCESKHSKIPYLAGIISTKDRLTKENILMSLMGGSSCYTWLEEKLLQNPNVVEGQCKN